MVALDDLTKFRVHLATKSQAIYSPFPFPIILFYISAMPNYFLNHSEITDIDQDFHKFLGVMVAAIKRASLGDCN